MMRPRFPIASLAALTLGATAAYAQSAPSTTRIDDIQVSREGETVSILVKLSQQPAAATAKASGDDLVVEIDGVALAKLALDPPPGSLVRHVEAGERKLTLSGAAFATASTVIYRNAVLVEARLAEPQLRGASLLAPSATAPSPQPAAAKEPEIRLAAPAPAPAPAPPKTLSALDEARPVALVPPAATSKPKPAVDPARCTAAAAEVAKDAWAVAALGDHALCLIDAGKTAEAKSRLDQLAAFAPDDLRIARGRAAMAAKLEKPADH